MRFKFGITSKLILLFVFFILIFYGTVAILLINVQELVKSSDQIVSKNNKISTLSKSMLENLLSMDENFRKFKLLGNKGYFKYYETARRSFESGFEEIISLETSDYLISSIWKSIYSSYKNQTKHIRGRKYHELAYASWVSEKIISQWINSISTASAENDMEILSYLVQINNHGRLSIRNGFIGLFISILTGLAGTWFISKSVLNPLNVLTKGLRVVSSENFDTIIDIKSKDEFGKLASAFNDMSRQLKDEENLRTDFISTLSHEIRTPLSSIRESVNMIIEEVLGPITKKQKKFLEIASSEIGRITNLLNTLLNVSRLKSGTDDGLKESIDPNRLIVESSKCLLSTARKKDIRLMIHPVKEVPQIMGVYKEIQQVLLNIIGNAIKFSPEKSKIDIYLIDESNWNKITFKIADEGPGISEEEQTLIFTKYYRAKDVRSLMDGVGLGLNISKKIIEKHGGDIYAKSSNSKGSEFYFTLPTAD